MLNKVMLIGNLGRAPEIRSTQGGDKIANLSVATSESWKDRNTGERKERTEWHRVAIFGKLAEIAERYLEKGSKVYLEGQIRTRKWQDQSGQDRYSTEVVLQGYDAKLIMLDGREGGGQQSSSSRDSGQYERPVAPAGGGRRQESFDDLDDEIPF